MENKDNKTIDKKAKRNRIIQMTLGICIPTLVASGISAGITYAIASKQLKLPSYTIRFLNDDGTVLQTSKVQIGSDAVYSGKTPTKSNPEEWVDYEWTGWDSSLKNIIADKDFKPVFEAHNQTYEMTWYDNDGSVLKTETLNKGKDPEYGSVPTKPSTAEKQYAFSGWTFKGDWRTSNKMSATANYDEAQIGLTIKDGVVEHFIGSGEVTIPSKWEGKNVTTIKGYAFASSATNATSITKVNLPDTITTLEPYAFAGATELTDIVWPNNENITVIDNNLFDGCTSLENITIPESVENINDYAFNNCIKLKTLKLGTKLKDFQSTAFNNCLELANVTIDEGNVRFTTLSDCPGMIFSKDKAVLIRCLPSVESVDSSTFPEQLTIITARAFQSCKYITKIDFSSCNVIRIDDLAFQGSNITEFVSGDKIETFGANVFSNCSNLAKITLGSKVDPDKMQWDSFLGCSSLKDIVINNNSKMAAENNIVYSLENGIYKAVIRCLPNNESPTIRSDVKIIGEYAFSGCSIKKIDFISGIEEIKANAFSKCTSVSEATLPDSVTKIGASIFSGCNALNKLSVGTGLHFDWSGDLDFRALDGCTNLKEIVVDSANTSLWSQDGVLYAKYTDQTTSITTEWVLKYPPLKDGDSFAIPNKINGIGQYAFNGAKNLKKVIIPANVFGIYDYAFKDCENLVNLEFDNNISELSTLSETAFSGCTNLNTLTIVSIKDLTTFANNLSTFISAVGSTKVTSANLIFNLSKTDLSELTNANKYKDLIKTITFDESGSTETISAGAFTSCNTIESVKFSSKITSIEKQAFEYCNSLTSISLNEGLKAVGDYAFRGSTNIEELSISSTLETIGQGSFANLNITSLNTKNVKTIGKYAFSGCNTLTELTLNNTITSIGEGAFNCASLAETINFNGTKDEWNNIQIGANAFGGHAKYVKLSDGTTIDL